MTKDRFLTPPAQLDGVAKREWRRMTKALRDAGLLADVDRPVLAMYCDIYSIWVKAYRRPI